MRTFVVIAKYFTLLFICVVLALCALFIWYSRIPSDSQVQQRFDKDKGVLVELLNKFSHEPPNIVGVTTDKVMVDDTSNWVLPEKAGFSSEHFAEYKVLMDEAHITQLWHYEGATNFNIAAFGFASEGWRLSFSYTKTIPSSLVPSIDNQQGHSIEDRGPVYRSLGDNWYIRLIY
jgi:hypothetical protein